MNNIIRNWARMPGNTRRIYLQRGQYDDYKELRESVSLPAATSNNAGFKKHPCKAFWRKLLKGIKKIFEPSVHVKFPYDAQSYMKNFDDGQPLDDQPDDDTVCPLFSRRFADPSFLFDEKDMNLLDSD